MAIQPGFSLSPLNPKEYTYDPANPTSPYFSSSLYCTGVYNSIDSYSLETQYNNNEIILGFNPVATNDQTVSSIIDDLIRHSVIQVYFRGINVNTNNQYLLLFALRGGLYASEAQFFIGTDLIRIEPIASNADEQIAILMDCPGNNKSTNIFVRLASDSYYAKMTFKGLDCFLL